MFYAEAPFCCIAGATATATAAAATAAAAAVTMATTQLAPGGICDDTVPETPVVVVVGAGVAGLACAQELRNRGIHQVTVVEASGYGTDHLHGCQRGPLTPFNRWGA